MIAVLGPGAVGGMLAARTGALCVARPETAATLREGGLTLVAGGAEVVTRPEVVEWLERPVSLLVIAVKAHRLHEALTRVAPTALQGALVLPLLNGLEHADRLREALAGTGATVAAGSIGRYQAYLAAPGRIVQLSEGAVVHAASDERPRAELEAAVAPLRVPGVEVVIGGSEAEVLWDKAARLAVLAAATTASGLSVGPLRADPTWRARLRAALAEACAAAAASGAAVDPAAQWAFLEQMDAELTTSTARDAAAGRPSELDAITGSVLRAARRAGVPAPELERLLAEAEER